MSEDPSPTQPSLGGVQAVGRALDVLEALAAAEVPLGISEIAATTGLPVGTVHRLLRTLGERGYARQEPDRKYAPGPVFAHLWASALRALTEPADRYLSRLSALTGQTASLAVLDGDQVAYAAQARPPRQTHTFAHVGAHVLPHCTAVGKVLLAFRPAPVVHGLVDRNGLPSRTVRTVTSRAGLLAELDRVRHTGYAVDAGEQEDGVRCLAVPVTAAGAVVAAISVSGPTEHITRVDEHELVATMQAVSHAFSSQVLSPAPRRTRPAQP
jgi:IclR family acetate operon transcriptional repressor